MVGGWSTGGGRRQKREEEESLELAYPDAVHKSKGEKGRREGRGKGGGGDESAYLGVGHHEAAHEFRRAHHLLH